MKTLLAFREKEVTLKKKIESTMTRLHLNGADQNSRSVARGYEEDNKTCSSQTGEDKVNHTVRSNDLDRLGRRRREYAEADKDFIGDFKIRDATAVRRGRK